MMKYNVLYSVKNLINSFAVIKIYYQVSKWIFHLTVYALNSYVI